MCLVCGIFFGSCDGSLRVRHVRECAELHRTRSALVTDLCALSSAPRGHVVLVLLHKRWENRRRRREKRAGVDDVSIYDDEDDDDEKDEDDEQQRAELMEQCLELLLDGGLGDAAVPLWLQKTKLRIKRVESDCTVCLDRFAVEEMFTLDCVSAHRFCFDCIRESVKRDMSLKSAPRCPARGCQHSLSEMEMVQLFSRGSAEMTDWTEIMCRLALADMGKVVVRCPTGDCQNAMVLVDPSGRARERCDCSNCGSCFCSLCRQVYHYRSACAQVQEARQIWIRWNGQGRQRYYQSQAQLQAAFFDAQARLEARHREQIARHQEEDRDEHWKEQHGRICPFCGRVIIKEGGCDSMVCGSDAHGGNRQNGCGQRFNWSAAQPYRRATRALNLEQFQFSAPELQEACVTQHGIMCDGCKGALVGIRFECMNCPSWNLCERCEFESDHPVSHVFRIRREQENVEAEADAFALLRRENNNN